MLFSKTQKPEIDLTDELKKHEELEHQRAMNDSAERAKMSYSPELSKRMTTSFNADMRGNFVDWFKTINDLKEAKGISEAQVYVYNMSPLSFAVRTGVFEMMILGNGTPNKPYVLCGSIPLVFVQHSKYDTETGEMVPVLLDGRRVMMDAINPDNLGVDQNQDTDKLKANFGVCTGSNNLSKRGVFWSLNNPPRREEVRDAKRRMENHYRRLVQEILATLYVGVHEVSFSPEHKVAMEYFGYDTGEVNVTRRDYAVVDAF